MTGLFPFDGAEAGRMAYERLMEMIQGVKDEVSSLAGDIRVTAQKVIAIEEHLRTINGKVQNHQSLIDQRQGQITMSIGLVTVGAALGGTIAALVAHFLK